MRPTGPGPRSNASGLLILALVVVMNLEQQAAVFRLEGAVMSSGRAARIGRGLESFAASPAPIKDGPDRQGLGGDGERSGPFAFLGGKEADPCLLLAPKFTAKRAAQILFKSSLPATVELEKEPQRAIKYGLIAAGISVAIIAVVPDLGTNQKSTFGSVQTALAPAAA